MGAWRGRGRSSGSGAVSALILLAVLASSGLTACASSSSARGKALRIPIYGDVDSLDPARATTPASMFVSSLLFSGLVKFGPDLHVIPELAVSIPTISDDGRTYTFAIRQDARFADGRPCTAADVAYSLFRALRADTRSPWARRYLGNIVGAATVEAGRAQTLSGVRVFDPLTVQVRLVHPDAEFLQKLALPVADIVDRRVMNGLRSSTAFPLPVGRSAGTGPWIVSARERDGSLELTPRPHFYGGSLNVRSLVLVPVPNPARAVDLYRRGALDVAQVPDEEFAALSARSDFHDSPSLDAYYAVPEIDPPQRASGGPREQALAAILDRDKLLQHVTQGLAPLSTIVPPAVPDYAGSSPGVDQQTSPDGAMGLPQAVLHVKQPGDRAVSALRHALYNQWPAANTPARRFSAIYFNLLHVRFMLPDPGVWLRLVLPQTHSRWYRTLLAQSGQLGDDPVSRMSAYAEAESWALAKALIIPLASGNIAYLIKPAVGSLLVTPLGLMPENDNWSTVNLT